MYQAKIDLLLFSKYPEIGTQALEQVLKTTEKFENFRLFYISNGHPRVTNSPKVVYMDSVEIGSIVMNPLLEESLNQKREYFGLINDDVWVVDGWLEDVLEKLSEGYLLIASGTADTDDYEHFLKVVEQTKDEKGVDDYLMSGTFIADCKLFRKIGLLDDRFTGACDDMDIIWRLYLNKIPSGSSRKITMGHWVGTSTSTGNRVSTQALGDWYKKHKKMKALFESKHGYESYLHVAKRMKQTYKNYFKQFRYLKREQT
ncbi:MAG: hypothetical protein AAB922_01275 [Patescibacteria group bacterium]